MPHAPMLPLTLVDVHERYRALPPSLPATRRWIIFAFDAAGSRYLRAELRHFAYAARIDHLPPPPASIPRPAAYAGLPATSGWQMAAPY